MTLKVILPRSEAEKHFSKELINFYADTPNPITIIFGIHILVTNEDIKEAILFDYKK